MMGVAWSRQAPSSSTSAARSCEPCPQKGGEEFDRLCLSAGTVEVRPGQGDGSEGGGNGDGGGESWALKVEVDECRLLELCGRHGQCINTPDGDLLLYMLYML